jgi:hypothetical protein
MAADVDICNMALGYVLSQDTIVGLDDTTPAGVACNRFYEICRNMMLQRYPWSFAQKTLVLSLKGSELIPNWYYCYALPSDCLDVQCILSIGARYPTGDMSVPFELGWYDGQRVLFTDETEATLRYTGIIDDSTLFPPDVVEGLAVMIASRICVPLGKMDMQGELMLLAEKLLAMAAARDMSQLQRGPEPDGPLVLSRL